GTMTNSERRISYLPKMIDAPGEAMPDTEIIWRFAQKMGYKGFNYQSAQDIFIEYTQITRGTNLSIAGLNYSVLKEKRSVQWPYDQTLNKGTERLFENNIFYTPDKKANILATGPLVESEKPSLQFPFILTSGRIRDHWHTMTKTGKVNLLNRHIKAMYVEMNNNDAWQLGIKENDLVTISNTNGEVTGPREGDTRQ
ncbi:MAG: NAD(P)H-nitrite reductase, partial [Bacteroidales bacterium]|nr:NAD(P)H-nitrite reductase [Bacteroidales bacterium]